MMPSLLDRLRARRTPLPAPVFDGLPAVRAYWEGLRSAGALPHRAQLDPRGLAGMLDRVLLADPIARGIVRVRVAGSALADLAGTDLRGLPLCCLFTSASRPLLAQAVEAALTRPSLAEIDLGPERGGTGRAVARLLILPLREDEGRLSLLGALAVARDQRLSGRLQILARREEALVLPPQAQPEPASARPQGRHLSLVHSAQ